MTSFGDETHKHIIADFGVDRGNNLGKDNREIGTNNGVLIDHRLREELTRSFITSSFVFDGSDASSKLSVGDGIVSHEAAKVSILGVVISILIAGISLSSKIKVAFNNVDRGGIKTSRVISELFNHSLTFLLIKEP